MDAGWIVAAISLILLAFSLWLLCDIGNR